MNFLCHRPDCRVQTQMNTDYKTGAVPCALIAAEINRLNRASQLAKNI